MEDITLKQLTKIILKQAEEKGFGTKTSEIDVAEKIALIHSEISEAFEAYRHKNINGKDGFKEELCDTLQRILHLCGAMNIDVEKCILKKIKSNKGRQWNWDKMNEKHSKI
jgi:NTP pyrophosphatase (non-canonical NTP hydrolase)